MSPARRRPATVPILSLAAFALALAAWSAPALASLEVFGAAAFVVVTSCCGALALRWAARLVVGDEDDLRAAVALLLFSCVLATSVTGLGFAGRLRLTPLLVVLGGLVAVSSRFPAKPWVLAAARRALTHRGGAWVSACWMLFAAAWLVEAAHAVRFTVQESDAMWYHLPMVAHWLQGGAIALCDSIPLIARAYPGYRQACLAGLSLPMGTEHLALLGLLEAPFYFVVLHVALRRAGATPLTTAALACYGATMPVVLAAVRSQGTDLGLGAHLVLSYVLVREVLESGRARTGVLAGLSLGALAALKFSGPIYALLVLGACLTERWWARALTPERPASHARAWLALCAAGIAIAGPWYLRNWIQLGNPLHPAPFLGFDGPLDGSELARKTLGWNLQPLVDTWPHFPRALGVLVPLLLAAPLLLTVALALRRRSRGETLALLVLVVACFVAFLHQPFNQPSYQPYYNMRYLIGWSGLLLVALGATSRARVVGPLFLLGAAINLTIVTRWAWGLAAAAALATFVLHAAPRLRERLVTFGGVLGSDVGRAALLVAALPLALGLEALRARMQYAPGYGYRDSPSDRGWGVLGAWAHRNLSRRAIGLHGDTRTFPYWGDRLDNRVVLFDSSATASEVAHAALERGLDFVVCLPPIAGRSSARDFSFHPSLAAELLAAHPERFAQERESRGASVLRVLR